MQINRKITIVMYHYVRDLSISRYPNIKGLDLSRFIKQLDYLKKNYNLIAMEQLIQSIDCNESLPVNSALLTFDDAYIDHFTNVFPILVDKKIKGAFYPSAKAISENVVLDVNKIHFILASVKDTREIIKQLFSELDIHRKAYKLPTNDFYYEKYANASRMDTKEVIFIKRLLQNELPENLRKVIIDNLFRTVVGISESAFSRELYMGKEQLKCMVANGMHVGNHGYDHYWLNSLDEERQTEEIGKGCSFLAEIGVDLNNWTMCYPYGVYNDSLIKVLDKYSCKLGLTTSPEIADLSKHSRFELPRLDTNDIPI